MASENIDAKLEYFGKKSNVCRLEKLPNLGHVSTGGVVLICDVG
jgi:hypothetical protein